MKEAIKQIGEMIRKADPSASLTIEFWDGDSMTLGESPKVKLKINSERGARDIIERRWLGFAEAFTAGEVDVDGDLQELLRMGLCIQFDSAGISLKEKLKFMLISLKNRNTRNQSPKNIGCHYDRGNEFYALYLDDTMTYSCAYFKSPDDSLEQAQLNKYEHIARKLLLKPGDKLVDIGCGWGGMLIYAAQKYGVEGLGCTLSPNQYEYAKRKIKDLGLDDKIEIVLKDYRDLQGSYDKFVSIGMFEHVGREFMPHFMKKTAQLLKKGGLGMLHTIGKDVEGEGDPWIMKHIFPGGYIPNLSEITYHMGKTGLCILDIENLRLHYAKTLDCWADRFEKNLEKVRAMFDEALVRTWRLYLNACSAGFKYGHTRLYQVLFSNGLNNELPMTRDHCYVC